MVTFEIEIPDAIYECGVQYAKETGITFSELCSLSVMKLLKYSDDELEQMSKDMQDAYQHE